MELTPDSPDPSTYAVPVAATERIAILDALRGIAILGILLMNIPHFGIPGITDVAAELNSKGLNYYSWYFISWIPDGTQRALFSMLFGAGIVLFVSKAEKKAPGLLAADYFFRRQLWLMVFSLFDVFVLLWYGDILLDYACLGMILFTFRNLSSKKLIFAAGICMLFMMARENRDLYLAKSKIHKGEIVAKIDTTVVKLTPLQHDDLNAMIAFRESSSLQKQLKVNENRTLRTRGSYELLYEFRTGRYVDSLVHYLFLGIWDVLQFMFLGMAFFKSGLLIGKSEIKVYWWLFIVGVSLGLLLAYFRVETEALYHFNRFDYAKNVIVDFYNVDRTFRALAFLGFIMLLYKSRFFDWFFALMRPVGQMAFTNYLMQSIICGFIFYGIGLGIYAQLKRYEVYYVVAAVWVLQILYSHLWLRYFRFGPFEWLWRSLTYWKWQPMRKEV